MPLGHNTALLSVHDAKVRKLLTDPAGGTATYGPWVDIPDMTSVGLEGDTDVKTRRGDGTIRDRRQVLTGMTITAENTILPADVLSLLEGGTLVDAGVTPNQSWTYTYAGSTKPNYVEFRAKCDDTDYPSGDFHLVVHKCQLNSKVPLGFTDEDFQTYTYELGSVARNADDKYYTLIANETKLAIV